MPVWWNWYTRRIQNPLPSGVAVQVRPPVPYSKTEPRRKSGLCCIWSLWIQTQCDVRSACPVKSPADIIRRKVALVAAFRRFRRLKMVEEKIALPSRWQQAPCPVECPLIVRPSEPYCKGDFCVSTGICWFESYYFINHTIIIKKQIKSIVN